MKSKQKAGLRLVAAALVIGMQIKSPSAAAAAGASPHEVAEIQKMIDANQIDDLVAFLKRHPHLLRGNALLAQQLRDFLASFENGGLFSFAQGFAGFGARDDGEGGRVLAGRTADPVSVY